MSCGKETPNPDATWSTTTRWITVISHLAPEGAP
jgi:hypothetical protein